MQNKKINCHNEASLFKASCGYLVRLLHFVRNDSSRGAMFGLDARIALAIFGALSVISGAALYSAIQQAKVVALVTELEELSKAYQQYILDTGSDVPTSTIATYAAYLKLKELVISSEVSYKGPYISYDIIEDRVLNHPRYGQIGLLKISNTLGTTTGNFADYVVCSDITNCFIFVYVNGVDHDIAVAVDKYIDGAETPKTGKLRLSYGFTGVNESVNDGISYKIMPALSMP